MNADQRGSRALRADGGAGGVGAVKLRREYKRPAGISIAAIHATDTALTKAGVERGVKKSDIARFRTRLPFYGAKGDPANSPANHVICPSIGLSM